MVGDKTLPCQFDKFHFFFFLGFPNKIKHCLFEGKRWKAVQKSKKKTILKAILSHFMPLQTMFLKQVTIGGNLLTIQKLFFGVKLEIK